MLKTKRIAPRFLICVENQGYVVSLEKRKIYLALPDAAALKHGQVRVMMNPVKTTSTPRACSCL